MLDCVLNGSGHVVQTPRPLIPLPNRRFTGSISAAVEPRTNGDRHRIDIEVRNKNGLVLREHLGSPNGPVKRHYRTPRSGRLKRHHAARFLARRKYEYICRSKVSRRILLLAHEVDPLRESQLSDVMTRPWFRLIVPTPHPNEVNIVPGCRLLVDQLGAQLHEQIDALPLFCAAAGQYDPRFGPQAKFLANGLPFLGTIQVGRRRVDAVRHERDPARRNSVRFCERSGDELRRADDVPRRTRHALDGLAAAKKFVDHGGRLVNPRHNRHAL